MACPLGVVFLESDYSLLNMPLPMTTQNTHKSNSPKIHYCTTNTLLYTYTYVSRYSSVVRDLTPVSLIRNHKSCLTLPFVLSIHVISTTVCNVCWNQDMKYLHNYATSNPPHYSVLLMFMVYMKSDTMRGQTGHLGTITLGFPLPHTHTEQVSPCAAIYLQSPCTSFPLPCSSAP